VAATSANDAITVRDILSIPVGSTVVRNAFMMVQNPHIDPDGVSHVVTQNWNNVDMPGLFFSVTRTTKDQWIVESQHMMNGDQTPLKFFHNTGTTWVFESGAEYHVPIRMTINR
jgi:hypothetical protein